MQEYQQGRIVNSKRLPHSPSLPGAGRKGGKAAKLQQEHNEMVGQGLLPEFSDEDFSKELQLPDLDVLGAEEQLCAVLEGSKRFKTLKSLAKHVGRSSAWLTGVRAKPEYQETVRRTVAVIAKRVVDGAVDVEELFNNEIRPSVETLVEVRDNPFEKAGDRVKAANSLIDHAPKAPAKKVESRNETILRIPVQQMQTMRQALIEEGQNDLVELLEGRDFKEVKKEEEEGQGKGGGKGEVEIEVPQMVPVVKVE
jgi:hypothetical protein